CSESELGLSEESEGILILPAEAPVGEEFAKYFHYDDVIFEVSVTPNRADCLSHWGLARELSCLLNRPCVMPEIQLETRAFPEEERVKVEVEDFERCPRYSGRLVRNIKVGPSPQWLKRRLESVDLKSINNVVDITNYVMMELGQPLHAFDVREIKGHVIRVGCSVPQETFVTLDGTEIELTGKELMIRDAERPLALAGVVGGLHSGVKDSTTEVFVESAHFTPSTVRRASRSFGIETDSAYRFSRGTDPEMVEVALRRACELLQKIAGGEVSDTFEDIYPNPQEPVSIEVQVPHVEERLGYSVAAEDFSHWMERLGCEVEEFKKDKQRLLVKTPSYRWDLESEIDLVEEYARLHGYEHIPETFPPLEFPPSEHEKSYLHTRRVVDLLSHSGYLQAVNYHFIGNKFQSEFLLKGKTQEEFQSPRFTSLGLGYHRSPVFIKNPLSEELNVMRLSLLPGLFKNLLHSYRYGASWGRLFEVGFVFSNNPITQEQRLGFLAWGHQENLWEKNLDRPVVYDLKADVETFLRYLGSSSFHWKEIRKEDELPFLHPGQSRVLFYEGQVVGLIGSLHPQLLEEHKIRSSCAVAEFHFEKMMQGQPRRPKIKPLSKFPLVERDLAFVMPENMPVENVLKELKRQGKDILKEAVVFDVYRGKGIPEGQKSVSFRLFYQNEKGTLSDKELLQLQEQSIKNVSEKLNISVRT
ncbi:MAG: phenylalanine--tRNA ligase subunit beta, partial [Bdellovibrio sp.]